MKASNDTDMMNDGFSYTYFLIMEGRGSVSYQQSSYISKIIGNLAKEVSI